MVIQYEQDWVQGSIFLVCQAAVSERKSLRTEGWIGCSPAHTQKHQIEIISWQTSKEASIFNPKENNQSFNLKKKDRIS